MTRRGLVTTSILACKCEVWGFEAVNASLAVVSFHAGANDFLLELRRAKLWDAYQMHAAAGLLMGYTC
jgi:hypothetical protein